MKKFLSQVQDPQQRLRLTFPDLVQHPALPSDDLEGGNSDLTSRCGQRIHVVLDASGSTMTGSVMPVTA